jgi:hypothetical protein
MWSSKPKERVYSGFMGDTSAEQEAVLVQFRQWVNESGFNKSNRWDDYDLLRFCRGRKFVLVDMQKMF